MVSISYDPIENLKKYSEKRGITSLLLSDADSKTIDAYGIRNADMDGKSMGSMSLEGVPHPGTYVLDKDGIVMAKLFLERYQERHTTEELLKAVESVR